MFSNSDDHSLQQYLLRGDPSIQNRQDWVVAVITLWDIQGSEVPG